MESRLCLDAILWTGFPPLTSARFDAVEGIGGALLSLERSFCVIARCFGDVSLYGKSLLVAPTTRLDTSLA